MQYILHYIGATDLTSLTMVPEVIYYLNHSKKVSIDWLTDPLPLASPLKSKHWAEIPCRACECRRQGAAVESACQWPPSRHLQKPRTPCPPLLCRALETNSWCTGDTVCVTAVNENTKSSNTSAWNKTQTERANHRCTIVCQIPATWCRQLVCKVATKFKICYVGISYRFCIAYYFWFLFTVYS